MAQSFHPRIQLQALASPLPTLGSHRALHVSACAHEYPNLTCTILQSQRVDGDSISRVHDALFCVVCFYGLVLVFLCAGRLVDFLGWIVWGGSACQHFFNDVIMEGGAHQASVRTESG